MGASGIPRNAVAGMTKRCPGPPKGLLGASVEPRRPVPKQQGTGVPRQSDGDGPRTTGHQRTVCRRAPPQARGPQTQFVLSERFTTILLWRHRACNSRVKPGLAGMPSRSGSSARHASGLAHQQADRCRRWRHPQQDGLSSPAARSVRGGECLENDEEHYGWTVYQPPGFANHLSASQTPADGC
jgi:hypothetical protein